MRALIVAASVAAALSGCASRPQDIKAAYVSSSKYAQWGCEGLRNEYNAIRPRLAAQEQAQQRRRTQDTWSGALIGITPTLFSPDNDREFEISMLKGEIDALNQRAMQIKCVLMDVGYPQPNRT